MLMKLESPSDAPSRVPSSGAREIGFEIQIPKFPAAPAGKSFLRWLLYFVTFGAIMVADFSF